MGSQQRCTGSARLELEELVPAEMLALAPERLLEVACEPKMPGLQADWEDQLGQSAVLVMLHCSSPCRTSRLRAPESEYFHPKSTKQCQQQQQLKQLQQQ